MRTEIVNKFNAYFQKEADKVYFSPGRINIIGEHLDYNGGPVLPATISLGIYAALKFNDSDYITIYSNDFKEEVLINISDLRDKKQSHWVQYITSMLDYVVKTHQVKLQGMDIYLESNLPVGSGLSSSAALLCLVGMISHPNYYEKNRIQLAKDAQQVEIDYMSLQCGIMDQFAIAMGRENCAVLLHCESMTYEYLDVDTSDFIFVVLNSGRQRSLLDSDYNIRAEECLEAYNVLNDIVPISSLAEATPMQLIYLDDLKLYARTKHILSEIERVKLAHTALEEKNMVMLGQLLTGSHESLRDDFEVSCYELDTIVEYALKSDVCAGARMIGAGFGGCCLAIVEKENLVKFTNYVSKKYAEKTDFTLEIFPVEIGDGVRMI